MLRIASLLLVALTILAVGVTSPGYDASEVASAIRDPATRAQILDRAGSLYGGITCGVDSLAAHLPPALHPYLPSGPGRLAALSLRCVLIGHVAPFMLPLLVAALAAGLARREAAGRGAAWSSNTMLRVAAHLFFAALLSLFLFTLSGVPLPFVYLPFALLASALCISIGNVPCKI